MRGFTCLIPLVVAVVVASGCGSGGGGGGIDAKKLSKVVLQKGDLQGEWLRFDFGRQGMSDAPVGTNADLHRFGREGGFKARYKRVDPNAKGPQVIESRADAFDKEDGAKQEFDALRKDAGAGKLGGGGRDPVPVPGLGEESIAAGFLQGSGKFEIRFYVVAWRQGNVTASIVANGYSRRLALADAVALARKQQQRLKAAF